MSQTPADLAWFLVSQVRQALRDFGWTVGAGSAVGMGTRRLRVAVAVDKSFVGEPSLRRLGIRANEEDNQAQYTSVSDRALSGVTKAQRLRLRCTIFRRPLTTGIKIMDEPTFS